MESGCLGQAIGNIISAVSPLKSMQIKKTIGKHGDCESLSEKGG